MAGKWVKSLQCKSRSVEDIFLPIAKHHHQQKHQQQQPLVSSASCRNSFQGLKDVIYVKQPNPSHPKSKPKPKSMPVPVPVPVSVPRNFFPSLSDLPEGHPSRNVVEIIFHTRWARPKSPFPGRVEMVLKVHNSGKTLTRFEEYRESVKSRAGPDDEPVIRCVADGNEMMRFYCLGPTSPGLIDGAGPIWDINGGNGNTIPAFIGTFSGSGAAHDSAGGGKGRRAMLVCRVIAGRVGNRAGSEGPIKGFDSVSGPNGELLVYDARAVLPCFLVIYKL